MLKEKTEKRKHSDRIRTYRSQSWERMNEIEKLPKGRDKKQSGEKRAEEMEGLIIKEGESAVKKLDRKGT